MSKHFVQRSGIVMLLDELKPRRKPASFAAHNL